MGKGFGPLARAKKFGLDKKLKICYNNNTKEKGKKFPKKIQKPLDKSNRVCYNKGTKKERGNQNERT